MTRSNSPVNPERVLSADCIDQVASLRAADDDSDPENYRADLTRASRYNIQMTLLVESKLEMK